MDQSFFRADLSGLFNAAIGAAARRAEAAAESERKSRGHKRIKGLIRLLRCGAGEDRRSKGYVLAGDERGVPACDRAQQRDLRECGWLSASERDRSTVDRSDEESE